MSSRVEQRTFLSGSLDEESFKILPRFVQLLSVAFFEIVFKLALVDCAVLINPLSSALSESALKLALIVATVSPGVLPKSMGFAFGVATYVLVSVDEKLLTFTLFQELKKVPSVCAYFVLVNAFAVLPVQLPCALIVVSSG